MRMICMCCVMGVRVQIMVRVQTMVDGSGSAIAVLYLAAADLTVPVVTAPCSEVVEVK